MIAWIDVRMDGDLVAVCVSAGNNSTDNSLVSRSVTFDLSGGGVPDINFAPYLGGDPLPPEATHDDVSRPSATSQTALSGTRTRILNLAVDGVHTYLYT